jgi:hypothetical protein
VVLFVLFLVFVMMTFASYGEDAPKVLLWACLPGAILFVVLMAQLF